jgi:hypothetical protein
MSALPGISRDSCPHCGERVRIRVLDLVPTYKKNLVACGACGKQSQIAGSTRVCSGVGGIVGALVCVALAYPWLKASSIPFLLLANVACGYLAGRLTLRLDPPELAD